MAITAKKALLDAKNQPHSSGEKLVESKKPPKPM
jgi:hypothetical protein